MMMTKDDLKKYTVIVENGSGCLFQPMTTEYTYILTAKHLFYNENDNEQGKKIRTEKEEGVKISIKKQIQKEDKWIYDEIEINLAYGTNYFPHKMADIAILKIPLQEGFDAITVKDYCEKDKDYFLCGFPDSFKHNNDGEQYRTDQVIEFGASANYSITAKLYGTLQQDDIQGMSGCGILKLNQEGISIVGIQSRMGSEQRPAGWINFVPLKYAKEIIEYEENKEKLQKLLPNTLSCFSFLKDKAFLLDVDSFNRDNADAARITLLNKAQDIIDSDVTPYVIRELFKKRLLISDTDEHCLSLNAVWIAWLEFLTIMNIIKAERINSKYLSDIFNTYRLKYVNVDDWTDASIRKEYGRSDYLGMQVDSTVIISSNQTPRTTFRFPKGKLIDISRPYDKSKFRTDKGIDPFTSFDFVHLDYFKTKCIIQKIEEYDSLNEEQIITKFKKIYNELFQ